MMISADKLQPIKCIDCGAQLKRKYTYGRLDIKHINMYSDNIHLDCECGAIYLWSYDETHQNGGVWKRRHVLPMFDDKARLNHKLYSA